MLKKTVILLLLVLVGMSPRAVAQEENQNQNEKNREGGFNLVASTFGIGMGGFYHHQVKTDIYGVSTFDILLINDEKELKYTDYRGFQRSLNDPNNVIILAMTFGAKKRLFRDAIEPNVRPFAKIVAGPTFGMNFPNENDPSNFGEGDLKNQFMWSGMVYGSLGADLGSHETNMVTVEFRYNLMSFSKTLGEKKSYNGLSFGFGFGAQF